MLWLFMKPKTGYNGDNVISFQSFQSDKEVSNGCY